ncbi:uncharacterized protein LOC115761455 [Drosophila novamexicana]|uniref:uncharacterized protein LOC115761455 n=1 Tax=Drosophila novamexicana TaxID=47314 RepID=UPI0011E5D80F|nr:uncharacterized protein LOC115761455 [Drosophila novamexicana]
MSGKRRCWTPSEEDRFLRIWYSNLGALHCGKKRSEVYRDLEVEFINQGIDISAAHIKAKMESFKRKYCHIIRENKPRKQWKNFDKMVAIMEYQEEMKETRFERPEVSSDKTFSSVYVDEVPPMFFNEEEYSQNEDDDIKTTSSSTMSTDGPFPRRTEQRHSRAHNANASESTISNTTLEKPKQRRRHWILQEEQVFLDVWQKYVRDLRGDRKKSHVYKDMELEFHGQGIEIRYSDVKAKIESLTRKFRKERDSMGADSEWIHYAKMAELLGALEATQFDQYSENSGSSSYFDDSSNWFAEDMPIYPKTCLKYERTSLDYIEGEPPSKKCKESESHTNNTVAHTDNAQDGSRLKEPEDIELEMLHDDSIEQPNVGQQSPNQSTRKSQLTEQFGKFVTKELNMLSGDLLIEAKRRIYNIICIMQMKQIKLNN